MKLGEKISIVIIIFAGLLPRTNMAQELSAGEIIKKADEKSRGKTSEGEMTMTVVRPEWKRTISMKAWSKGTDYSLILVKAPAKDKGQVFLKRQKEMWNWVPSIEKLIKIPPSMMMQSWMGSDFTNDDLVKESSIVSDYEHKLLGKDAERGLECYKIELVAKPDAPVVWGKIISWITVEGFNQWKAEFYDEDMKLINVQHCYDIKKMGDREIPTRFEIEPLQKKGNKTIMIFTRMVFDKPISEDFFSQQNMRKIR